MTTGRGSLFCGTELAARIESAETGLISTGSVAAADRMGAAAGFTTPLAGGVACFAEPGSPLNKVAGLGFAGTPSAEELDRMENYYAAKGSPIQIELAHLADPALAALLTQRGYQLVNFENVLGLSLPGPTDSTTAPDIQVRPSDDTEFDRWLDVVADGFAHPDTQGVASHEAFPREIIAGAMRDLTAAAGVQRYVAIREGQIAGGASLRLTDGIAQLTGAATLAAHRRRGIQSALLSARLAVAATAGCDLAVITTQPGSKSQQNAQRRGFDLLYTRAILVKD